MLRENAAESIFEIVTVLGKTMLFTEARIDRDTVPENLYMYEVRHDDDQNGDPVQIGRAIWVNYLGTLISAEPLDLQEDRHRNNAYLDIDPEKDWTYETTDSTLKEYMDEYLPKAQDVREMAGRRKPHDRGDDR